MLAAGRCRCKRCWLQGNWGIALLAHGQHKRTYLSILDDDGGDALPPGGQGVLAREAAAMEASKARLKQEARQALTKAGQLFREVVKVATPPAPPPSPPS